MARKKSNMLEWSADLASRSPEGSEERALFSEAKDEYYEATTWPSGHPNKNAAAMRAKRRFEKAWKLRTERQN